MRLGCSDDDRPPLAALSRSPGRSSQPARAGTAALHGSGRRAPASRGRSHDRRARRGPRSRAANDHVDATWIRHRVRRPREYVTSVGTTNIRLSLHDRLDAAYARAGGCLVDDAEQADLAGVLNVRPAAELFGELADDVDRHHVRVHGAELPLGAEHLRLLTGQHQALDVEAFGDLGVDDLLHARERLVGEALGVGEVEAQPVFGDVRAPLVDVVAEDLAQGGTEQVRCCVHQHHALRSGVRQAAREPLLRPPPRALLVLAPAALELRAPIVRLDAVRTQLLDRQLGRQAVRLEQAEEDPPVDVAAPLDEPVDLAKPALERPAELGLLAVEHVEDLLALRAQVRVDGLVALDDRFSDGAHERPADAEPAALADGAAHQPAQHVALVGVALSGAAPEQQHRGAEVIGDDPLRALVRDSGQLPDAPADRGEQVRVVDGRHPLQQAGEALQAHAGVDVAPAERAVGAVRRQLVGDEDVVPYLQPALVGLRLALGVAVLAGPVEDLGVRAARAVRAGRTPPVVLAAVAMDALPRDPEVDPALLRLVVEGDLVGAGVHGHAQAVAVQAEGVGEQLQTPAERVVLEVVAERPVAEHLETGEVRVVPDLFDVRGAQAALVVDESAAVRVLVP